MQKRFGKTESFGLSLFALSAWPVVAAASTPTTFKGLVNVFLQFFAFILIPFILGIIFLFFVWKVIDSWVINAGDENKRSEGKAYVLAAIAMMVLIFSFWGIINILSRSLFAT